MLTFEEIPRDECLALLAQHRFGRLAVSTKTGPMIFPVNYALGDDRVVFRTDPGTKLEASVLRSVAFEIDGLDLTEGTGWSVVVQGTGEVLNDAFDPRSLALRALPVRPLAPGLKEMLVVILPDTISGRRLVYR